MEGRALDRSLHATACVFLAGKVDDNPRDVKSLIRFLIKHPVFGAPYLSKALFLLLLFLDIVVVFKDGAWCA